MVGETYCNRHCCVYLVILLRLLKKNKFHIRIRHKDNRHAHAMLLRSKTVKYPVTMALNSMITWCPYMRTITVTTSQCKLTPCFTGTYSKLHCIDYDVDQHLMQYDFYKIKPTLNTLRWKLRPHVFLNKTFWLWRFISMKRTCDCGLRDIRGGCGSLMCLV